MIESSPNLFGNAWRLPSACMPRPSLSQLDPCDTHQQTGNTQTHTFKEIISCVGPSYLLHIHQSLCKVICYTHCYVYICHIIIFDHVEGSHIVNVRFQSLDLYSYSIMNGQHECLAEFNLLCIYMSIF